MRSLQDPEYTSYLLDIGNGTLQEKITADVRLPGSILLKTPDDKNALPELINRVYPEFNSPSAGPITLNRAILTTKNKFVDEINKVMIHMFPRDDVDYHSYDETTNPNDQGQYIDLINSITANGLPPHNLTLKVDAPIILLRNLDPSDGLCNGTRLICKALGRNVIRAEIVFGILLGKVSF